MPVVYGRKVCRQEYRSSSSCVSSSGGSSPTKPASDFQQKVAYQVTVNHAYADEEEENVVPPSLPPRNYRPKIVDRFATSDSHRHSLEQQHHQRAHTYSNDAPATDFENTPKADYYADQLRQQARKISRSQPTILNAARYQPKALPEMKTCISVSRPVERQPVAQEAKAPPTVYCAPEIPKDLNFVGANSISGPLEYKSVRSPESRLLPKELSPHSSPESEENPYEPVEVKSGNIKCINSTISAQQIDNSKPKNSSPKPSPRTNYNKSLQSDPLSSPNLPSSSPPLVNSGSAGGETSCKPLSPPSVEEIVEEPRKQLVFGEDVKGGSPSMSRYTSDSFELKERKRGQVRQGLSGNYKADNDVSPTSTPVNRYKSRVETREHISASGVNPAKSETMVKVATVMTVSTSLPPMETKVKAKTNTTTMTPVEIKVIKTRPTPTLRTPKRFPATPPDSQTVESSESPSVRRFVANFEKKDWRLTPGEKPPVQPRTKVAQLKESLIRRSQENLSDIGGVDRVKPAWSTENIAKVTVVPSQEEDIEPKTEYNTQTGENLLDNRDELPKGVINSPAESKPFVNGANEQTESVASNETSCDIRPVVVHVRQKSQEEVAYDQHAKVVASQLMDQDKQLSEVILPPPEHKTATDFMSGIFDTEVDLNRRPSLLSKYLTSGEHTIQESMLNRSPVVSPYTSPSGGSSIQDSRIGQNSEYDTSLEMQKVVLVERLEKKLEILRQEKDAMGREISENKQLGAQVREVFGQNCTNKQELNKFNLYVDELDKVMYLLLKLSGRLARAENALSGLPPQASEERKTLLTEKRDELSEKHDDAKVLKEGIDRRSPQVATFLRKYLTEEEFADYEYYIKMNSKLAMEQQEIEDKIQLGEEQLRALRKSLQP